MNFLFACGGSAGHINPALAIATELRQRVPKAKILFVGAGKDLEKKLIPRAGYHIVNIKMSGLKRGFSADNLAYNMKTVRNLATAGFEASNLLHRFKPDAVIGTGGYICYPVLRRAALMGIPTVIHESNAIPGLTTKLLSASVDKILVAFPGLEDQYRRTERLIFTGTPVQAGFETAADSGKISGAGGKPLVVSFWGSLGAERMNETIADFIMLNISGGEFDHIHASGKLGGVQEMLNRLERLGAPAELPAGIEIREYIDDMPNVMAAADIVLCRAGASTLAELTVMGKPAILIPSPYVASNHQEENAKQLKKAGGAIVLPEKDCTGEMLYNIISPLLKDSDTLIRMANAQKSLAAPKAAGSIAGIVMQLCNI